MSDWTPTEETFCLRGEGLGAKMFRVEYPEPGDGPNWMVIFPSGYVEPVYVRDPSAKLRALPDSVARGLAKCHHPVNFIDNEATVEAYWRKKAYQFPGGAA